MEDLLNISVTTVPSWASSSAAWQQQQGHQQDHHHQVPPIRGSNSVTQQVPDEDNNYPQHPYPGASSSVMPLSTTAALPIDPALATASGWPSPVLCLMPVGGVMSQPVIKTPHTQGRRGNLPSTPDTPDPRASGTTQAKDPDLQKDSGGRFHCHQCGKSYAEKKHLKRHLQNHNNDRPYACIQCSKAFKRTDILRRHSKKCTVGRSEPTRASHLSHRQARTESNVAAQQNLTDVKGDTPAAAPWGLC